jgi:drug/metabolite transporter (DMT)-like permease
VTAVAGALCISTSAIVMKLAGASPSATALGRCGFALPVLALLAALERRRRAAASRAPVGGVAGTDTVGTGAAMSGRGRWLARLAGVFLAGDLILWSHSITDIGAGLSTVLSNLQVIIVPVLAWLLLGERPRRSLLVAAPVMVFGLVLVSGVVTGGGYGADPGLGVVFGVGVGVLYSGYILLLRRAAAADGGRGAVGRGAVEGGAVEGGAVEGGAVEGGAVEGGAVEGGAVEGGGAGGGPVVEALFEATAGAAVTALILGLLLRDFRLGPAWPALGWLVVLALTSGVLGWLLITLSLPRLPAGLVSALLLVQPACSVLLGAVILRERPSLAQLGGVAAMLVGVLIAAGPTSARNGKATLTTDVSAGMKTTS